METTLKILGRLTDHSTVRFGLWNSDQVILNGFKLSTLSNFKTLTDYDCVLKDSPYLLEEFYELSFEFFINP